MTALIALVLSLAAVHPSGPIRSGTAKFYSAGTFYHVALNRHMTLSDDVDGYASTPYSQLIGQTMHARFLNPVTRRWSKWESFQILDCSAPSDKPRHLAERLRIEVDHATAVRHGFVGEGKTSVEVVYP